jgi:hypothetical protein
MRFANFKYGSGCWGEGLGVICFQEESGAAENPHERGEAPEGYELVDNQGYYMKRKGSDEYQLTPWYQWEIENMEIDWIGVGTDLYGIAAGAVFAMYTPFRLAGQWALTAYWGSQTYQALPPPKR